MATLLRNEKSSLVIERPYPIKTIPKFNVLTIFLHIKKKPAHEASVGTQLEQSSKKSGMVEQR